MKKIPIRNYLTSKSSIKFTPQAVNNQCFANFFQNQTIQQPVKMGIDQIKHQIQLIKRKSISLKKKSETQQSTDRLFLRVSTNKNTEVFQQIKVNRQQQTDKFQPIFSPYRSKQLSQPRFTIDSSFYWKQPKQRYKIQKKARSIRLSSSKRIGSVSLSIQKMSNQKQLQSSQINNSFKIKKMNKQKVKENKQQEIYNGNLCKLQKLYEIMIQIVGCLRREKQMVIQNIRKYMMQVSEGKFNFIQQIFGQINKRYHKILNFARIMQNTIIMYLALGILEQKLHQNYTNLSNMLGYSAINILFLYKIYILTKNIQTNSLNSKFQLAIHQFQKSTFKQSLITFQQIILRLQHHNQINTLLQNKLSKSHPKFSHILKKFYKNIQRQNYSCSQATHYLFQFMAYFIYQKKLNHKIDFLDIAPNPYLLSPLEQNKFTLIIQPKNVLFIQQNSKQIFRPFIKQFLDFIFRQFQVIFWTQLMPNQIDPILNKLDKKKQIMNKFYRYHCKEEQIFIKNLNRIGRNVNNILIIDEDKQRFRYNENNGIALRWDGNISDNKLVDLSQILMQILKHKLGIQQILKVYNQQINNLKGEIKKYTKKIIKK